MEASNTRNDLEERLSSAQQSAFKTPPKKRFEARNPEINSKGRRIAIDQEASGSPSTHKRQIEGGGEIR